EPPRPAAGKKPDGPKAEDKKAGEKKPDGPPKDEPGGPPEPAQDEKEVLERVSRNLRSVEKRLANREVGQGTRQLQEYILKDLESLLRMSENPPPQGGQQNQQDQGDQGNQGDEGGNEGKQGGKQNQGGSSGSKGGGPGQPSGGGGPSGPGQIG